MEESKHFRIKMERYSGVGRIRLWQFLLELLLEGSECVEWTKKDELEFKMTQPRLVAEMWGETKSKGKRSWSSFYWALRAHTKRKFLSKVEGEEKTFRFGCYVKSMIAEPGDEKAQLERYQIVEMESFNYGSLC